jgi:hypothetical protein
MREERESYFLRMKNDDAYRREERETFFFIKIIY